MAARCPVCDAWMADDGCLLCRIEAVPGDEPRRLVDRMYDQLKSLTKQTYMVSSRNRPPHYSYRWYLEVTHNDEAHTRKTYVGNDNSEAQQVRVLREALWDCIRFDLLTQEDMVRF